MYKPRADMPPLSQNEKSVEFGKMIQRLQKQIPEDETLQDIQVETLTIQDFNAWNRYLTLIKRLSIILPNDEIDTETQESLFRDILQNIPSSTFLAWMRNRIGIILVDLEIINMDSSSKSAIQKYIESEIQRFT